MSSMKETIPIRYKVLTLAVLTNKDTLVITSLSDIF